MKYLDLTLVDPAENLACDEVLLHACETGSGGEVLRLWESARHFVVLGYGDRAATEVNRSECERRGVPILRRCTGGGTVLQGPGCFNYTLVLRSDERGLQSVTAANRAIMERNRVALESVLRRPVSVRGCTDLALDELKFSGNAQRRQRRALLFHGTFLLNMDLKLISDLLPMPSRQPNYRVSRAHAEFLLNLNVDSKIISTALCQAWQAHDRFEHVPLKDIAQLAREKYATEAWNFRF